eukprot:IDg12244t1
MSYNPQFQMELSPRLHAPQGSQSLARNAVSRNAATKKQSACYRTVSFRSQQLRAAWRRTRPRKRAARAAWCVVGTCTLWWCKLRAWWKPDSDLFFRALGRARGRRPVPALFLRPDS